MDYHVVVFGVKDTSENIIDFIQNTMRKLILLKKGCSILLTSFL